ncbi:hypothetical protein [Bacillus altitudinis]|uniref:hypothetical protein n=1 Tax=Bacillus altitudinis TaxID=293387 RepID=UPI00228002A3|nr:hypothetical protein [Bacillus altitudinis]MCY7454331.1 DUF3854 domain-containing protein [Bacillus altitudinis]
MLMRRTKLKDWYEFIKASCPVCGHSGGCMQYKDGKKVACIRVESEKAFSKGKGLDSYLHYINGYSPVNQKDEEYKTHEKLNSQALNFVYSKLLNLLSLSDKHLNHLMTTRHLTIDDIIAREYKTFPEKPWVVTRQLMKELGLKNLKGIPGFYLHESNNGTYWNLSGIRGSLMIPYRNEKNEIVGFQTRVDQPENEAHLKGSTNGLRAIVKTQPALVQVSYEGEIIIEEEFELDVPKPIIFDKKYLGNIVLKKGNRYFWLSSANKREGTSCGNPPPIHVSRPSYLMGKEQEHTATYKAETIWITEGALKGDIACSFLQKFYNASDGLGETFVSLPGVNSWALIKPLLREMEVKKVIIAIDSDASTNNYVKKHLLELIAYLEETNIKTIYGIWSMNTKDGTSTKGIDDLFINGYRPMLKPLF